MEYPGEGVLGFQNPLSVEKRADYVTGCPIPSTQNVNACATNNSSAFTIQHTPFFYAYVEQLAEIPLCLCSRSATVVSGMCGKVCSHYVGSCLFSFHSFCLGSEFCGKGGDDGVSVIVVGVRCCSEEEEVRLFFLA